MPAETFLDNKPTEQECAKMEFNYFGKSMEEYFSALKERASNSNTSIDFERIMDMQELVALRGDFEQALKYRGELQTDYATIYNRMFNE